MKSNSGRLHGLSIPYRFLMLPCWIFVRSGYTLMVLTHTSSEHDSGRLSDVTKLDSVDDSYLSIRVLGSVYITTLRSHSQRPLCLHASVTVLKEFIHIRNLRSCSALTLSVRRHSVSPC